MNRDTNLAAWMIGGGHRAIDPSEARNLIHERAHANANCGRPGLVARLATATLSPFRPASAPIEPRCCPA